METLQQLKPGFPVLSLYSNPYILLHLMQDKLTF